MIRSNSSSKWKQVLGFDDGLAPVTVSRPPFSSGPELHSSQPPRALTLTYQSRFPRDITFTRANQHDLYLSPSFPPASPQSNETKLSNIHTHSHSHTQPPLFYAAIQQDTSPPTAASPKPDIVLHAGPSKSASIISFATFHPVTQSTEITLCPLPPLPTPSSSKTNANTPLSPSPKNFSLPSHRRSKTEKLVPTGGIFTTEKHGFYHTSPSTLAREKFEWRQSSSSNSAPFATMEALKESGGLKLVRISRAESVAVYAGVRRKAEGRRVAGLFRFLGEDDLGRSIENGGLGEEFEVLALVSLLAVLERGRRAVLENKLALGVN